jgi:hypothetical protein
MDAEEAALVAEGMEAGALSAAPDVAAPPPPDIAEVDMEQVSRAEGLKG